jgi:hypothetical protein
MTSLIAKIGLAALVALTGIAPAMSSANASQSGLVIEVQHRDHYRDRDRRHHHGRPGCSPWRAEAKAERMGLRRVRVVDVSRRTVTVVGRDRHGRDRVVFANVRGCPIIRR